MTSHRLFSVLLLGALIVPSGFHRGPVDEQLIAAYSQMEASPGTVPASFRNDVRHLLQSSELKTRQQTWSFLLENLRWIDVRQLEDILLEGDSVNGQLYARHLLGYYETLLMPREEKVALYLSAMTTGEAQYPRGFGLPRTVAMLDASRQGLTELREPIISAHALLTDGYKSRYPLSYFLIRLELAAGAENLWAAGGAAFEKLSEWDPKTYCDRILSDGVFRTAVSEFAHQACAKSPFDGSQPPGCEWVWVVYNHVKVIKGYNRRWPGGCESGIGDLPFRGTTIGSYRPPKTEPRATPGQTQ